MRLLVLSLLALILSGISINAQSLEEQTDALDQFISDGIKKVESTWIGSNRR